MTRSTFYKNCSAAAEVIGALLLVVIAIGAFAAIYLKLLPVPLPPPEPHVQLAGFVTADGTVVIEHMGGEELNSYEIFWEQSDGSHEKRFENDPWKIGECYYPPINDTLFNQEKQVKVSVYDILQDGSTQCVFDGIITPKDHPPGPGTEPELEPMAVSTLRTNTVDEDLICYSYSIHPNIIPVTFIYNWMVDSAGPYHSLTRLLLPFDTNSSLTTKDYSGYYHDGAIVGATWTNAGKVGGAYSYNGHDSISIPYSFSTAFLDQITVEVWVKTSLTSGAILSYDREKYWGLSIADGKVKWSTNASDGIVDLLGTSSINNNDWHYLVTTYDSETGEGSIYVDGRLDIHARIHRAGSLLGSGCPLAGAVGKSVGNLGRRSIFSTSFESSVEKNNWSENNSGATGIKDYVDTLSNVSDPLDIGSHSNFNNEKAKDSSYDTLIEGNTAGTITTTLLDDGFEGGLSNWNTDWELSTSYYTSPTHSIECDEYDNDLTSISLSTTGASSISISFKYRVHEIDDNDDVYVQYYDGSQYDNIEEIGDDTENTWLTYSHTFNNAGAYTQYFINNFRLRITGSSIDNSEYLWIDDVLIQKKVPGVNYELDLETQWTNVNYQLPNKELCIYTGTLGNEDIIVEAWNATSLNWYPVFSDLNVGWNNKSITNLITSPTFTIRYRDGSPTSDFTQDSWNIDAALLHLWATQGIFDIFSSTALIPRSGSYSIGGSGDFDPDYDAYNRTGIDISNYKNVTVSVWYSYKNTQPSDFLGLYYLYNHQWVPIFNKTNLLDGGGQSAWTNAQIQLPSSLSTLFLQFRWKTSSLNEYVAIDDLNITGVLSSNEGNFTGIIDEVKFYERVLSPEQIHQNYLCSKDGNSTRSVIVSEETSLSENWKCIVIPNNGIQDDVLTESNIITIFYYPGGGTLP